MNQPDRGGLSAADLSKILEVTRGLAAPFDLTTMLTEVTAAARQVLHAERSSVWLYDDAAAELVLKVSSDISDVSGERARLRFWRATIGIVFR